MRDPKTNSAEMAEDEATLDAIEKMAKLPPTSAPNGRRAARAKAEGRAVITPPPRAAMSERVKKKLREQGPGALTVEENRLLIFALPRKARRANKIRTTGIREEIRALTSMLRVDAPLKK